MPGIDGPDLAARLRELQPDVPVLFVSGHADTRELVPAGDARTGFLQKPYSFVELERKLAELLSAE